MTAIEALDGTHTRADYSYVTEVGGQLGTAAQLQRAYDRYRFAEGFCDSADVLELGCGVGQGLGLLARRARRVVGVDIDAANIAHARATYAKRTNVEVLVGNAEATELPAASFDVVILFEALYYLDAKRFAAETRRLLRPGGVLLLCTANKDLPDFNPSPLSTRYLGPPELSQLLGPLGFSVETFGGSTVDHASVRARVLRRLKRMAVRFRLIPKTMRGKALLKRLVFGRLVPMPHELADDRPASERLRPTPLDRPDRSHQVIYCAARLAPTAVQEI